MPLIGPINLDPETPRSFSYSSSKVWPIALGAVTVHRFQLFCSDTPHFSKSAPTSRGRGRRRVRGRSPNFGFWVKLLVFLVFQYPRQKLPGHFLFRLIQHLRRRTTLNDPALAQDRNLVSHPMRESHLMRH
jgi:hypothetical protein